MVHGSKFMGFKETLLTEKKNKFYRTLWKIL